MNGLQSLDQWNNSFGWPTGGKLGLLNAIQVRRVASMCAGRILKKQTLFFRTLDALLLTPFPHTWLMVSAVAPPFSSVLSSCVLPPRCKLPRSQLACSLLLGQSFFSLRGSSRLTPMVYLAS